MQETRAYRYQTRTNIWCGICVQGDYQSLYLLQAQKQRLMQNRLPIAKIMAITVEKGRT